MSLKNGWPVLRRSVQFTFALSIVSGAASSAFANNRDSDDEHASKFFPGNLVVSRSVYPNQSAIVTPGTVLPPGCQQTRAGCSAPSGATSDGTYPYVWNNVLYDSNFGISSRIFLDQLTPTGFPISSLEVPYTTDPAAKGDHLATSFSSKSEVGLHLTPDGRTLTFMGYVAPINQIDVSNSNTPGAVDPTNPDGQAFYRAVATVDRDGRFTFTETNAYSGNNGRSAVLIEEGDKRFFFTTGNAGNGSNPQPSGVVLGAGAQFIAQSTLPEAQQTPSTPTPLASFSVTKLGVSADKIGKDDNFRGLTVFNNVVYMTKGSGSNGVNTVYFVDTTGNACPNGTGIPAPHAKLPVDPLAYAPATLQSDGLPSNMCILAGFPSTSNKVTPAAMFPFGLWFADSNTLYVADEGDGYTGGGDLFTHAAAQKSAGLQKWVFNPASRIWTLAYTLVDGLGLGKPYSVHGYPMGSNAATGLPWTPATDGLRNIVGHVGRDGIVTVWATTSTVSGNGDTGADPNRLVAVQDVLKDKSAAEHLRFVTLRSAGFGEVLRGVALTPGTELGDNEHR
ncbi:hypothetical protein [Burkholderia sp. PAMC 26561]|uniref:hypothetical protein n=1 Tax=Burkholderia sp. PAMC 26561 TaxID=1795043 RepID=UPI00076B870B|nr:hypothetical protein [Burkholderia sp. PAMC 26561]AME26983.1 hypothetical protein AXG89_23775 [Burkholderia sp. PAMC 26561]AME27871.1 hypothetical protein AXG89_28915 [Burkholderia sp. PAMC 26561]